MTVSIHVAELMNSSGVQFGTSGARGLATAMNDRVCYVYTRAFVQHIMTQYEVKQGDSLAIAGDFRPSTPRIMQAVMQAVLDAGLNPVYCGFIATPALACYAMANNMASIMVTGSHIPDDRNGIKFYRADGEILKDDEAAIRACAIAIDEAAFDAQGMLRTPPSLPPVEPAAAEHYLQRYQQFFPADCLRGRRIGVYQHSTVLRDTYVAVLEALGATVVTLGRSEHFIPVDTEAIRPEDVQLAAAWAAEYGFDAIVSADGDGDRPLISDEHGQWLRGDVAGILCAQYVQADSVITPVSSNSALELSGCFDDVRRTRIGSPYVIAAMQAAVAEGRQTVVGYEANGGFLTATSITLEGRTLTALPTRDAILVPLTLLMAAGDAPISRLVQQLPPRFTSSGRLKDVPVACSQSHIADLLAGGVDAMNAWLSPELSHAQTFDTTDGLRITLDNGEIVHIRPSGNAPELRCYNEADHPQRAEALNALCLKKLAAWK